MVQQATIPQDVDFYDGDEGVRDAADAFLKKFVPPDADKPSQDKPETTTRVIKPVEEQTVKVRQVPPEETPDEDETPEPDQQPAKKYAEDDAFFKIKVGDEEHEVAAKDLRRLYGQESALTRRSQEVAELRRKAEEETTKATASLAVLLKRAQERAAPYRQFDFMKAARELEPTQVEGIRQAAVQAYEEENFLQNELNGVLQTIQTKQQEAQTAAAEEAVGKLTDPASPYYIEEWGDPLYDEMRAFGISNGISEQVMDNLTDAPVFKLLHDAMMYQKGKQNVVVTKKVDKTPKKIIKNAPAPAQVSAVPDKEKQLTARLRRSGATDDAAELFMARWARNAPEE